MIKPADQPHPEPSQVPGVHQNLVMYQAGRHIRQATEARQQNRNMMIQHRHAWVCLTEMQSAEI
jgi:hypothetical protein